MAELKCKICGGSLAIEEGSFCKIEKRVDEATAQSPQKPKSIEKAKPVKVTRAKKSTAAKKSVKPKK